MSFQSSLEYQGLAGLDSMEPFFFFSKFFFYIVKQVPIYTMTEFKFKNLFICFILKYCDLYLINTDRISKLS